MVPRASERWAPHDPYRHHHGGYSQDRDRNAPAEVNPVLAGGDTITDRWVDDETDLRRTLRRRANCRRPASSIFVIVGLINLHTEAQVDQASFAAVSSKTTALGSPSRDKRVTAAMAPRRVVPASPASRAKGEPGLIDRGASPNCDPEQRSRSTPPHRRCDRMGQ